MKHFKVEVPKGYAIDKENSTFEKIVFKKVNELPKRWEDLQDIKGCYPYEIINNCLGIFKTSKQAEASIYVAMLTQLRDVYRQGWDPDWSSSEYKYVICFIKNKISKEEWSDSSDFLSFQSEEIRDLFLENCRDYIEKIKPLYS